MSEQIETTNQTNAKSSNLGLTLFVCLLTAIIGAAGGYLYLQQTKVLAVVTDRLEQQKKDLVSLNEEAANKVAVLNSRLTEQGKELSRAKENLSRLQQNLATLSGASQKDWALAEVEYLLRLANQRLLIEKEPSNAIGIIASADELLKGLDDPALNGVREAIAKDLAALNSMSQLDRTGMYLQLVAAGGEANKLQQLVKKTDIVATVTNDVDAPSAEQTLGDKVWSRVSDLVKVRYRGKPIEPILPPDQDQYLRQNIRLMLEQSQLSLLRGEQALYENSLDKVMAWLDEFYQPENSIAAGLKNTVSKLKGINIEQQTPDISGSLREIRIYIVKQHGIEP